MESASKTGDSSKDLESFRTRWKNEIHNKNNNFGASSNDETTRPNCITEEDCLEIQAQRFFLKGVELEKIGQFYDAIKCYRKAIQLVPDIEFKMRNFYKAIEDKENCNKALLILANKTAKVKLHEEKDLIPVMQDKIANGPICAQNIEQMATHISALPTEILLYLLRWVVSSDLDLQSLEAFSQVCGGFYLCARDPELWKLACLKVWGVNCGKNPDPYTSWRSMFIEKPRVNFNGCYISKTTYIRPGEDSFQDQFYRPWHLIAYYRYIRFFPEGKVLILTSSEEPKHCIHHLKRWNTKTPALNGYYRLKDDKVILMVQREEGKQYKKNKNREDEKKEMFHLELQILNHKRKKHVVLKWMHYSIRTMSIKGEESSCSFDLIANKFPALWFSRVKSYTSESGVPLI